MLQVGATGIEGKGEGEEEEYDDDDNQSKDRGGNTHKIIYGVRSFGFK
jgi:hypothetical protein